MKNFKTILALAFVAILSSCSKSDDAPVTVITPPVTEVPTLKPFVDLPRLTPPGAINNGAEYSGMVYSPTTKNLYISFYTNSSFPNGFSILQVNTETKVVTTVYNSPTTVKYGHPQSLRIFDNSIYLTTTEYTTPKLLKLDGIGTNTLTLAKTIDLSSGWVVDVAIADKMYLLDLAGGNQGNQAKVLKGDIQNFQNVTNFEVDPRPGFQSSILYINQNSNPLLIQGSDGGKISAYNPVTGSFIRSVTVPGTDRIYNGNLEKDSQNRIYCMNPKQLIRYSADLLTREIFDINGFVQGRQFAIAEEANQIRFYSANDVIGVYSMTIPK